MVGLQSAVKLQRRLTLDGDPVMLELELQLAAVADYNESSDDRLPSVRPAIANSYIFTGSEGRCQLSMAYIPALHTALKIGPSCRVYNSNSNSRQGGNDKKLKIRRRQPTTRHTQML